MNNQRVAVISTRPYRAESLASVIGEKSGCCIRALSPEVPKDIGEYELVLVDIDQADEETFKLVCWIAASSAAKIVLLGLAETEETVIKAAEAGASGYVGATATIEQLLATLSSVRNGEFSYPPQFTYALFKHLALLAYVGSSAQRAASHLSTRERKILDLVSQNLTNKEIAARLFISEYTVKNHVHRILRKLGVHSRIHASTTLRSRRMRKTEGES